MFRKDVSDSSINKLPGNVEIFVPVSWQLVGYFIVGIVLSCLIFLSLASYTRVEIASGSIVPAAGISLIVPGRSGVIASLPVEEGQEVKSGAYLALIRAEEDSASIETPAVRVESAIAAQDSQLFAQEIATEEAVGAQLRQFAAQHAGLVEEVKHLQSQIAIQQNLVSSAHRELDRIRPVAARGFISVRDMQQREEALLVRQQGLSQLAQALAAKRASMLENERSAAQAASQGRAQKASVAAARAGVAQQAANAASSRSYVLRAPLAGRVTELTANVGQSVTSQSPLMTILPSGSELRAELEVSSSAIGFVKPGQEVRIAIDAFPYQRFGSIRGKVLTVAASPISRQSETGVNLSAYPVTVSLHQRAVPAYGRREPLISGMTLTARIITEERTLLAWLFEPLLAVQKR